MHFYYKEKSTTAVSIKLTALRTWRELYTLNSGFSYLYNCIFLVIHWQSIFPVMYALLFRCPPTKCLVDIELGQSEYVNSP